MTNGKETIIKQCMAILHRDDVKGELKKLITPIVDMILVDIYPYLYVSLAFIVVSFLLHIGIFVLLFRGRYLTKIA